MPRRRGTGGRREEEEGHGREEEGLRMVYDY